MTRVRAATELFFAAAVWGFGFIAAVWTLQTWGPFWATTFRFLLATAFTGLVVSGRRAFRCRGRRAAQNLNRIIFLKQLRLSFGPGLLVGATLLLQTWGLASTTATKSSFITALYVTVVPFAEWTFFRRQLRTVEIFGVGLAILGVGLMTEISNSSVSWQVGDVLTMLCAVTAAAQIVWIGTVQRKIENAFEFNGLQSFWALLMCGSVAYFKEPMHWPTPTVESWWGLLSLSVGSTAIAFTLQIRAQRVLSSTTSSLFFLLEAPFAAGFAYFLLHERLSSVQTLGGLLILVASLITLLAPNSAPSLDSLESPTVTCENKMI